MTYNFNPTYKCISIVAKTLGGAVVHTIVGRIPLNTHNIICIVKSAI